MARDGGAWPAIRALGSASVPRLHEIAIDGRVLLFTLAVSVLSGVAFGLAPALRLGRFDLTDGAERRRSWRDAGARTSGASG